MRSRLALLLALAACDALGAGNGGGGSAAKMEESGTKRGSAGGFSAQLSSELGKQGVEPASIANPGPAPKTTGSTGSAAQMPSTGSGTKVAVADVPANDTKAAPANDTKAAPANDTKAPANDTKAAPANDTKAAPANDTKVGDTKLATPAPGQAPATQTAAAPATPGKGIANRVAVKPSAEQAQIKFDLEPNWERDVGEAGTFSLVVKVPNGDERVFYAKYAFEDQSAPPDCDSYRKFLEDKKLLTVTLNRQRGAACYIEGTDASGVANYRYLVTYSGKRLLCTGSLYKDQAALGDLRDKVLMQAKKICETLAL